MCLELGPRLGRECWKKEGALLGLISDLKKEDAGPADPEVGSQIPPTGVLEFQRWSATQGHACLYQQTAPESLPCPRHVWDARDL